jgi:hypothetical protein
VTLSPDPAARADEPDDAVAPHRAALVEQALATHREQPELRVVGLVIEPDAPEAEAFRQILPPVHRAADQDFVGTMPRDRYATTADNTLASA